MPLTEIIWSDDDDALGGGPANSSGNRSTPGPFLVAPTGSGTLVTLGGVVPPPAPTNVLVAVLDGGTGFLGFSAGAGFGSLTPSTFGALNFINLYYDPVFTNTLILSADAVVAQSAFTSITVNGVTLNSADATFTTPFGTSVWQWASEPFTVPGTYDVTFV